MASCLVWLVKMIWEWNFKNFWTFLVIGHKKFTALFLEWGTCTKVTVLWKLMSFHIFFHLSCEMQRLLMGLVSEARTPRVTGLGCLRGVRYGGSSLGRRSSVGALRCPRPDAQFYLVVPRSFVGGLVHDARLFDGIVLKKIEGFAGPILFNKQTDDCVSIV